MSIVAYKFVVPYDLFYREALDEGALKAYVNFLIYINAEPTIQQAGNSILRANGSNRILGRD